jgi:hypothetical protein
MRRLTGLAAAAVFAATGACAQTYRDIYSGVWEGPAQIITPSGAVDTRQRLEITPVAGTEFGVEVRQSWTSGSSGETQKRHLFGVITSRGELALVEEKQGQMSASPIEPTVISVLYTEPGERAVAFTAVLTKAK